jgi:acetyl esterase/lipase
MTAESRYRGNVRTVALAAQLLFAVVIAAIRAVAHRLRHGPAVPGWGWMVELRAVALRAFIMSAAAHPDPAARAHLESRFDPPLPRRLRRVLRRRPAKVGGVPGEWIERADPSLGDTCTLLYFHGGGYVAGSPATHREWVSRLTWSAGVRTFVPDYRLAPAHRFPAALDDAIATYEGLLAAGTPAGSIVVAGDSAGGGLATALLLRLRDEGRPLPAGTVLYSPYTDLTHSGASIVANAATDYLPLGEIRPNTEYLGDHDPTDPYASPVHGDFTGIPPLLVFAGGREMILDDSTRLVDRARSHGCDAVVHIAEDMYHVWPAVLPHHPDTLVAEARTAEWITTTTRES